MKFEATPGEEIIRPTPSFATLRSFRVWRRPAVNSGIRENTNDVAPRACQYSSLWNAWRRACGATYALGINDSRSGSWLLAATRRGDVDVDTRLPHCPHNPINPATDDLGTLGPGIRSSPATTTATNELILGADTIATTTTGVGGGFASRVITSPDSDLEEDKAVSATGNCSATASLSSGSWVMQMAALKAAAGSTSPPEVAVSVRASSTTLATGATQQFTATVTGTTNTACDLVSKLRNRHRFRLLHCAHRVTVTAPALPAGR